MRDVLVRAGKTFIQAALGYVCTISLASVDWTDKTVVMGVVLAAVSAGLSALMNIEWNALSEQTEAEVKDGDAE